MRPLRSILAFALACALIAGASVRLDAQWGQGPRGGLPVAAPAGPTFDKHVAATGQSGPVTTAAVDTTGDTLLIVHISQNATNLFGTVTDSVSNIYSNGTCLYAGAYNYDCIYYKYSPTTNAAHTFTFNNGGRVLWGVIDVETFKGTVGTTIDQQNGFVASGAGSTCQPGSITPGSNNEIVVSGYGTSDVTTGTITVNSSMSITDSALAIASTNSLGAMAYKIQTTAAAINPTWTSNAYSTAVCVSASFK